MSGHTPPVTGKAGETNAYVKYLENEMTIMGILSSFCLIVIGGCITILSGIAKDNGQWLSAFWHEEGTFISLGLFSLVLSAFFFYRQRSLLSHYVGQIYLGQYSSELADCSTEKLHQRANNWVTWRFYRFAFLWLFTAGLFFARVALLLVLSRDGRLFSLVERQRPWEIWTPAALCVALCLAVCMAFAAFPDDDHPYAKSFRNTRRFLKGFRFIFRGGLE